MAADPLWELLSHIGEATHRRREAEAAITQWRRDPAFVIHVLDALAGPDAAGRPPGSLMAAAALVKVAVGQTAAPDATPPALLRAMRLGPQGQHSRLLAAAAATLWRKGWWPTLVPDLLPLLWSPPTAPAALWCLTETLELLQPLACMAQAQRSAALRQLIGDADLLATALRGILGGLGVAPTGSDLRFGSADHKAITLALLEVLADLAALDIGVLSPIPVAIIESLLGTCLHAPGAGPPAEALGLAAPCLAHDLLGGRARDLVLDACWRRLDAPDPVVAAAAVRCLRTAAATRPFPTPVPAAVYHRLVTSLLLGPTDTARFDDDPARFVVCVSQDHGETLRLLEAIARNDGWLPFTAALLALLPAASPIPSEIPDPHALQCCLSAGTILAFAPSTVPSERLTELAVKAVQEARRGPLTVVALGYLASMRRHIDPIIMQSLFVAVSALLYHEHSAIIGASAKAIEVYLTLKNLPLPGILPVCLTSLLAGLCSPAAVAPGCAEFTAACLHRLCVASGGFLRPHLPSLVTFIVQWLQAAHSSGPVAFWLLAAVSTLLKHHAAALAPAASQLLEAVRPLVLGGDRALASGALQLCGQLASLSSPLPADYGRLLVDVLDRDLVTAQSLRLYVRHLFLCPATSFLPSLLGEVVSHPRGMEVLRVAAADLPPDALALLWPTLAGAVAHRLRQGGLPRSTALDTLMVSAHGIVKLGPAAVAAGLESQHPGAWGALLCGVWGTGLPRVTDEWDRKVCVVALIALCQSQELLPDPRPLLEAADAMLQAPGDDDDEDGDASDAECPEDGTDDDEEGCSLQLPAAQLPEHDPCPAVPDARACLRSAAASLSSLRHH